MALRLIEIYHEESQTGTIEFLLKSLPIIKTWHDHMGEGRAITNVLLKAEDAEQVLNELEEFTLRDEKTYRVVILPVEATIPRREAEPEEEGSLTVS